MEKEKVDIVNLLIQTEDAGKIAFKELVRLKHIVKLLVVRNFIGKEVVDCAMSCMDLVDDGYMTLEDLMGKMDNA